MANLDRVQVIGIQERYDELLTDLADVYGWSIPSAHRERVAHGSPPPVSEDLLRRIREDCAYDLAFYDAACRISERRRRG